MLLNAAPVSLVACAFMQNEVANAQITKAAARPLSMYTLGARCVLRACAFGIWSSTLALSVQLPEQQALKHSVSQLMRIFTPESAWIIRNAIAPSVEVAG